MAQLRNFFVVLALLICAEAGEKENIDTGDGSSNHIIVKVVGRHTVEEIPFRVRMNTPMGKLKNMYSMRVGVPVSSVRFLFDGIRIKDDDTPKQLEMENDDVIDVYPEQTGDDNGSK